MKTELAFFDMDGTLCVPRFEYEGELVKGFPETRWAAFCRERGDRAYDLCIPVRPVQRYAEKLRADGVTLYVLTTSQSPEETAAKRKYTQERFPGLFARFIAVDGDAEKIPVVLQIARQEGVSPTKCEMVEDTYAILFRALEEGIRITHISELVSDL